MSSAAMVEFRQVTKDYPLGPLRRTKLRALDAVSMTIEPGQVFGLLGPNRAGKTTLIKLLLSLSRPTSGEINRLGRPASDHATLAHVGYVHENQAFPRYLTATALLEYYGALSFLPEMVVKERTPRLLELVGLADRAKEPIARFSKGMVQRLGIAQALINDPQLLVLDEPTEGLDLTGRQVVRSIVAEHRKRDRSVLFVSHVLSEVEILCDRVGILSAGRLVFQGALADLKKGKALEAAVQERYAKHA